MWRSLGGPGGGRDACWAVAAADCAHAPCACVHCCRTMCSWWLAVQRPSRHNFYHGDAGFAVLHCQPIAGRARTRLSFHLFARQSASTGGCNEGGHTDRWAVGRMCGPMLRALKRARARGCARARAVRVHVHGHMHMHMQVQVHVQVHGHAHVLPLVHMQLQVRVGVPARVQVRVAAAAAAAAARSLARSWAHGLAHSRVRLHARSLACPHTHPSPARSLNRMLARSCT